MKQEHDEVTTGEAARLCNVSIQTIHNWFEQKRITGREEWQGTKRVRYIDRKSLQPYRVASSSDPTV